MVANGSQAADGQEAEQVERTDGTPHSRTPTLATGENRQGEREEEEETHAGSGLRTA